MPREKQSQEALTNPYVEPSTSLRAQNSAAYLEAVQSPARQPTSPDRLEASTRNEPVPSTTLKEAPLTTARRGVARPTPETLAIDARNTETATCRATAAGLNEY